MVFIIVFILILFLAFYKRVPFFVKGSIFNSNIDVNVAVICINNACSGIMFRHAKRGAYKQF